MHIRPRTNQPKHGDTQIDYRITGSVRSPFPLPGEEGQGENSPKPDSRLEPLNRKGEKPKDLGRTKMFFPSFPHLSPSQIFGWVHGEGERQTNSVSRHIPAPEGSTENSAVARSNNGSSSRRSDPS